MSTNFDQWDSALTNRLPDGHPGAWTEHVRIFHARAKRVSTDSSRFSCIHPDHNKHLSCPEYNGKESWDDYAVQFTIISQMNSWGEVKKGKQLAASLSGWARRTLTELYVKERTHFVCLNKACN